MHKVLCLALLLVAVPFAMSQPIRFSPEVHGDRTVTFRFKDPGASKVEVAVEGSDPIAMRKGADGIWSATTTPLAPDLYGYTITADGQAILDPANPVIKPNLIWPGNMVLVPGSPPKPWEVANVPHGVVHHHFYHSAIVGDDRDYFVYTPPGYSASRHRLPVLYLLHGYSDTANAWTEVGKANVILDNLIASGTVNPMVVVMTLGYGVPDFASPTGQGFSNRERVALNYTRFRDALFEEVMPAIEREYRVSTKRTDTAIAGLSMGAAESLFVGLNSLDRFAWVGAFSAGGLEENFDEEFPGLSGKKVNKNVKLLYISCGTSDGLLAFKRHLVEWLESRKVNCTAVETPGRHAWMVWRRNLIDFAPRLFK